MFHFGFISVVSLLFSVAQIALELFARSLAQHQRFAALSSVSIQIRSSRMYSIARRDRCDRRRCALLDASSCDCPSQRTGDGGRRDLVSAEARVRKRPCWCASISGKGLEYRMGRSRALFGSKWRFDPLHPSECCDNLGDRSYRAMQRVSVMSDRSLSLSAESARIASRQLHRGHGGSGGVPGVAGSACRRVCFEAVSKTIQCMLEAPAVRGGESQAI